MTSPSTGRAVFIGALLALIVAVLGVGALVGRTLIDPTRGTVPGEVLVVMLADDADGARVVGAAFKLGVREGLVATEAIDPDMKVEIEGTHYDRLRDAYAFGGGAGVSDAYASASGEPPPAWVVIDEDAFLDIVGTRTVTLHLRRGCNVFVDGQLRIFSAGVSEYDAAETRALLDGIGYLDSGQRRDDLRDSVTAGLSELIASDPAALRRNLEPESGQCSMSAAVFDRFISLLEAAER